MGSEEDNILQVRKMDPDGPDILCGNLLFSASGVGTAGWKRPGELLYVKDGNLVVYSIDLSSSDLLVDRSSSWSEETYAIIEFNFDGTVFIAYHAEEDQYHLFRISEDGRIPEPWPSSGNNVIPFPSMRPSIERF